MTRFKRRILFGATLVVLVLLGLGVWFYFTFFGSTNIALQRAETFLFRRMKVAKLAEKGSYRFFYVTNRRLGSGDGPRSRLIYQVQAPNGAVYWVLTRGR